MMFFFADHLNIDFPLFKVANNKIAVKIKTKSGKKEPKSGWDSCDTLGDLMVSAFLYLFFEIYKCLSRVYMFE